MRAQTMGIVEDHAQSGSVAVGGAVIGAIGLWLANRLVGKAAMQTAMNHLAEILLKEMKAENAGLRKALLAERVTAREQQLTMQGEIDNLHQVVESLERVLRDHGVIIPQRTGRPKQDYIQLPSTIPNDP